MGKDVVAGKLVRQWDRAQTPYQRLLASGILAPEQEARLAALYAETNPRQLREKIYQAVERLWQPQLLDAETKRKEVTSAAR